MAMKWYLCYWPSDQPVRLVDMREYGYSREQITHYSLILADAIEEWLTYPQEGERWFRE